MHYTIVPQDGSLVYYVIILECPHEIRKIIFP